MELCRVEDAVGMVLCHDMTEIIPGVFKGSAFKKGHIIEECDIERLLNMGKKHIYVYDLKAGYVHEDEAAKLMAKFSIGSGITYGAPNEGKVSFYSKSAGVLKVNREALFHVNALPQVCFATIHENKFYPKDQLLGGTRVIPLVVEEEILQQFEAICKEYGPILTVNEVKPANIGLIITGSEVATGRITDQFGPVLSQKAKELGANIIGCVYPGDDATTITKEIKRFISEGADLVEVSGGMSVDPDDRTPGAIKACGGEVVTYGTPVLPGAMFMLSYVNQVPVVGLPGCVMYAKRTVYDLVIPRILTGEKLSKEDFVQLSYGGQCLNCKSCNYPNCGFGC